MASKIGIIKLSKRIFQFTLFLILGVLSGAVLEAQEAAFDIAEPDENLSKAYQQYWESFQLYEKKMIEDGKSQYKASWDLLEDVIAKNQSEIKAAKILALKQAKNEYEEHLKKYPDAESRSYARLNIAQVMNRHADLVKEDDKKLFDEEKIGALKILDAIEKENGDFQKMGDVIYLQATIYESLNKKSEAMSSWGNLTKISPKSIHTVYAYIAIGDHWFYQQEASIALKYYKNAEIVLNRVAVPRQEFEVIRLNYRLAWAAYKSGELETVIKAAKGLLLPGDQYKTTENRKKIQKDAVELIGDALYEGNVDEKTHKTLENKEIKVFAAAIGLRSLKRYLDGKVFEKASDLGEFLIEKFPLSDEYPEICQLTAEAYDKSQQTAKKISALEKAAFLLPGRSLWRARHQGQYELIRDMEMQAKNAARVAADYHYGIGLSSGDAKSFKSALSLYEILIENGVSGTQYTDSNTWRLRAAHAEYFLDQLTNAADRYNQLKRDFPLSDEDLEVASYQLALTYEKLWRKTYAGKTATQEGAENDPELEKYLNLLEKAVDEFVNRFSTKERAIDLLFIAATVNHDYGRFDRANRFWQRALLLDPSVEKRAMAIRGLVHTTVKGKTAKDVIEVTRKLLVLENWAILGRDLEKELKEILSKATLEEGERLRSIGQPVKSGSLMVDVAREFEDLPRRPKIFRDGAYMLALGGQWNAVKSAAEEFLRDQIVEYRSDMIYILGKAQENGLEFRDAAVSYLRLAEKYPQHPRAKVSLNNAEKLAVGENDYGLASKAAFAIAAASKDHKEKIEASKRGAEYADKAKDSKLAIEAGKRAEKAATSKEERLTMKLINAKMLFNIGNESQSISELEKISKECEAGRTSMDAGVYREIAGESNFLLGEEARRQFEDFSIIERGGDHARNIDQKERYFKDMTSRYERAIKSKHPLWASQARFRLGEGAENIAKEIAKISTDEGSRVREGAYDRMRNLVKQYQDKAKEYYGQNITEAKAMPLKFKDNEWIKRSAVKLTGQREEETDVKKTIAYPEAEELDLPYQWSL